MTDEPQDEFDRECDDYGTDEYVSDCNRLPFTGPLSGRESTWCMLICLAISAVLCSGAYGLYELIAFLIRRQ